MKTRLLIIAVLFLTINSFAQNKNYLFSIGDTKLGGYLGTSMKYTNILDKPAGFMDFKAAVTLNGNWAFGVSASGLYYDKKLNTLVSDGTYHLYAGYVSVFVERIFSINEDFKFSLSISSGQGEAYYQYDKEYHQDKIWSEEIIDKTTFYALEPAMEIQHRVSGNFWLGLTGTFRSTSPIKLLGADESMLRKFTGGLTFKWGVF